MKKLSDFFCCFCSGYFYPPLIAVLIYLGHSFNLEIPFLILLTLIILACCIFAKDIRFLITPLLCLLFLVTADHSPNVPNYSDYYTRPQNLWVLISCGMILVLGLACFVIRHRKSFHRISLQRGLLPGILLFCLAMCLNGIGTPTYSFGNLGYGATFLVSLLLVYLLFYGFFRFDEGATDYLMYNLVIAGLLICIQLITAFFTDIQFDEAGNIIKESVILGWGVWTTIGGMLCMLMPACFYFLATKKLGWLGLIAGVTEWFCIFLSQSRGALLFGSFILLACMITASFCGSFQRTFFD